MARLIDADKLVALLNKKYGDDINESVLYLVGAISGAPTVDAVEVVRCKDCKYAAKYAERNETCGWVAWYNKDDDFCSMGKKEEEKTRLIDVETQK